MKSLALGMIRIYQATVSQALPPQCRYIPTCSHYTSEAISKYGLVKGVWMGTRRIARCNPFRAGGYDPVP